MSQFVRGRWGEQFGQTGQFCTQRQFCFQGDKVGRGWDSAASGFICRLGQYEDIRVTSRRSPGILGRTATCPRRYLLVHLHEG
jgi:hypothetical protein